MPTVQVDEESPRASSGTARSPESDFSQREAEMLLGQANQEAEPQRASGTGKLQLAKREIVGFEQIILDKDQRAWRDYGGWTKGAVQNRSENF